MRKLIVNSKYNNKALEEFLYDLFPTLNKGSFFKALRKKDIIINGKRVSENVRIYTNDEIIIYITDDNLFNVNFSIIFEDENILLINKMSYIEIVGENSLTEFLKNKFSKDFFPCHRLDKNTLGLILFAKNEKSLKVLEEKFKSKEIEKHYKALVYGIPKNNSDTMNAYLFKDSKKSIVYISDTKKTGYLPIITKYSIIETNKQKNTSLLDVTLVTGRTHQIRAHLAYIGLPIIGDRKIW